MLADYKRIYPLSETDKLKIYEIYMQVGACIY